MSMIKRTTFLWLLSPVILIIGFIAYFEIEYPPAILAVRGISNFNLTFWEALLNVEQFWGQFYVNTALALLLVGFLMYFSPRRLHNFSVNQAPARGDGTTQATQRLTRTKKTAIAMMSALGIIFAIMLALGAEGYGFRNGLTLGEILLVNWQQSQIYLDYWRVCIFASGLLWVPILLHRYHRREWNPARSRVGLLALIGGWGIVVFWLITQAGNLQFLFQGTIIFEEDLFAFFFLLPVIMFGISVIDNIAPSNAEPRDSPAESHQRHLMLRRILGFMVLFGGIFGGYLLGSALLSLNNVPNNGIGLAVNAEDLMLRCTSFCYVSLLTLALYAGWVHWTLKADYQPSRNLLARVTHRLRAVFPRASSREILGGLLGVLVLASAGIAVAKTAPASQLLLLYDQAGYQPSDQKIAFIQLDQPFAAEKLQYVITPVGQSTSTILQGQPIYAGFQFGEYYYSVDFSAITLSGDYHLTVTVPGYPTAAATLHVAPNCYDEALVRACDFYYYQRCDFDIQSFIPEYPSRPACHDGDGYVMDDSGNWVYRNMSGGWHDAGDYGKYMEWYSNTQWSVYALATTYENLETFFNNQTRNYGGNMPDVLAEATWGADFLEKMTLPDGRVYTNLFDYNNATHQYARFSYGGQPQDDPYVRVIGSLYNTTGIPADITTAYWRFIQPSAALMVAAALGKVAYLLETAISNASSDIATAIRIANYTSAATAIASRTIPAILASPSPAYDDLWTALLADLELSRLAALPSGSALNATALHTDSLTLFTLLLNQSATIVDDSWGNELGFYALCQCAQQFGLIGNVTQVVTNFFTQTLQPLAQDWNNVLLLCPFGTLQSNSYLSEWGNNIGIAMNCFVNAMVYNLTADKAAKNIALDQLHWILGRNPLAICQEENVGVQNLPLYHSRYVTIPGMTSGAPPGAIPNGVIAWPVTPLFSQAIGNPANPGQYGPQKAYLDLQPRILRNSDSADFYSNEIYITNNGAFIFALSELLAVLNGS